MPSLATLAIIFTSGAVLYSLGRAILAALVETGRSAERVRETERKAELLRRQSEIMLEAKDPENVAEDLDSGRF
jgi:hypothetical protein